MCSDSPVLSWEVKWGPLMLDDKNPNAELAYRWCNSQALSDKHIHNMASCVFTIKGH